MQTRKHHDRPRSQRDHSLPYTYEAWVDILEGRGSEPVYDHFFSDTLCGLIECLENEEVAACKKQCPDQWTQVCGDDGVSYRNDCHASCSGAGVVHSGAC